MKSAHNHRDRTPGLARIGREPRGRICGTPSSIPHRATLCATLCRYASMGEFAPLDLAAEELRLAAEELGRITGRIDVEELLGTRMRTPNPRGLFLLPPPPPPLACLAYSGDRPFAPASSRRDFQGLLHRQVTHRAAVRPPGQSSRAEQAGRSGRGQPQHGTQCCVAGARPPRPTSDLRERARRLVRYSRRSGSGPD